MSKSWTTLVAAGKPVNILFNILIAFSAFVFFSPSSGFWAADALMERSCDWVRGYLLNNPNVSESDKHLCDGIGTIKR
ncbi:MAG: hypothetical protein AB4426_11160 [Xenococcaceae cyanobacterium]